MRLKFHQVCMKQMWAWEAIYFFCPSVCSFGVNPMSQAHLLNTSPRQRTTRFCFTMSFFLLLSYFLSFIIIYLFILFIYLFLASYLWSTMLVFLSPRSSVAVFRCMYFVLSLCSTMSVTLCLFSIVSALLGVCYPLCLCYTVSVLRYHVCYTMSIFNRAWVTRGILSIIFVLHCVCVTLPCLSHCVYFQPCLRYLEYIIRYDCVTLSVLHYHVCYTIFNHVWVTKSILSVVFMLHCVCIPCLRPPCLRSTWL